MSDKSRVELYLERLINGTGPIPEPESRVDHYLVYLIEHGGGGGEAVQQYDTREDFPAVGEVSKLYVARIAGELYRWDADAADYFPIATGGASVNAYESMLDVGNTASTFLFHATYTGIDYGYAVKYADESNVPIGGGCSAIVKDGVLGCNFDYPYDNVAEFVVDTPAINGRHAVTGIAGQIPELTRDFVASGAYSDKYKFVPFALLDGQNDAGLRVKVNVVPNDRGDTVGTAVTETRSDLVVRLNSALVVRYLLDHFATVDEAIAAIEDHISIYVPQSLRDKGYEVHYILSDRSKTRLLEFVENECVWVDASIMTNFYVSGVSFEPDGKVKVIGDSGISESGLTARAAGLERYNILAGALAGTDDVDAIMQTVRYTQLYTQPFGDAAWLSEYCGSAGLSVESPRADFADIYAEGVAAYAVRDRNNPVTHQTIHTAIYDGNTLTVYTQERYATSQVYRFALPERGGGSFSVVEDYPEIGVEDTTYLIKTPTVARVNEIDRPTSGNVVLYRLKDTFEGLPVEYSYDVSKALHTIRIMLGTTPYADITIPFGLLTPQLLKLNEDIWGMFEPTESSEGNVFYIAAGREGDPEKYAQNLLLPLGINIDIVAENAYIKFSDDFRAEFDFDTLTNSIVRKSDGAIYEYGNLFSYLDFLNWSSASTKKVFEATEEDCDFICPTTRMLENSPNDQLAGFIKVVDRGLNIIEGSVYKGGKYTQTFKRPDRMLDEFSPNTVENRAVVNKFLAIEQKNVTCYENIIVGGHSIPDLSFRNAMKLVDAAMGGNAPACLLGTIDSLTDNSFTVQASRPLGTDQLSYLHINVNNTFRIVYTVNRADDTVSAAVIETPEIMTLPSFDAGKTQIMKNVNGTLMWVDEV